MVRRTNHNSTFPNGFIDVREHDSVDALLIDDTRNNSGSVRQLAACDSDISATTIENYCEYDSFGNITHKETPAVDHVFGYTGRERDEETGLHFYRVRYYDPVVGRFISEDPIGFEAEDANLNRYVQNDPLNNADPMGLKGYKLSQRFQAQWDERGDGYYFVDDGFYTQYLDGEEQYTRFEKIIYVSTEGTEFEVGHVVRNEGWDAYQYEVNNSRHFEGIDTFRSKVRELQSDPGKFVSSHNFARCFQPGLTLQHKLVQEYAYHRSRAYFEPAHMDDFFRELNRALSDIGSYHVENSTDKERVAAYRYETKEFRLVTQNNQLVLDQITAVHELVHVLDVKNRWYLPDSKKEESGEALAYGAEALLGAARKLSAVDKHIVRARPSASVDIESAWRDGWNAFSAIFTSSTKVRWNYGNDERAITPLDIKDVGDRLGLKFSYKQIRDAYLQKLRDFGISNVTLAKPAGLDPGFD